MNDLKKVIDKFQLEEVSEVEIFKREEEVRAEERKIVEEINDLKWLLQSLKEQVEEKQEESMRWRRYYEGYASYYKTLSDFKNYLDAVLFEVRASRKEKVASANALIREVGAKRVAFSNLVNMISRAESMPLGSRIKALEELKRIFEERLEKKEEKKEEKEVEKGGEEVSAGAEKKA